MRNLRADPGQQPMKLQIQRRRWASLRLGAVFVTVLLAACQSSPTPSSTAAPVAPESPSSGPASPTPAAITPRPSSPPLPLAIPRPTDLPIDGTCESSFDCLGLLSAGAHQTKVFNPGFRFAVQAAGWENIADSPGHFELLSLDNPGDLIGFYRQPRPTKPDGTLVAGVDIKVKPLETWLASNTALMAGATTPVTVGGLAGGRIDVALAPGLQSHQSDCPVQVCGLVFLGRSNTWAWDVGVAGPERERYYVLTARDGVVLIVVDSLDGTTFDALTTAADAILATAKFDGT